MTTVNITGSKVCKYPRCTKTIRRIDGYCSYHALRLGTRRPNSDPEVARRLLNQLRATGWTVKAISESTGLSDTALTNIANRATGAAHHRTIALLEGLQGTPPVGVDMLPAWPYTRRIRALAAAGHRQEDLARRMGLSKSMLSKLALGKSQLVAKRTANAVMEVWGELAHQPLVGPPTFTAARLKWEPPFAWDDIDNPEEHHPEPNTAVVLNAAERAYARNLYKSHGTAKWPFAQVGYQSVRDIAAGKYRTTTVANVDLLYREAERVRTQRRKEKAA